MLPTDSSFLFPLNCLTCHYNVGKKYFYPFWAYWACSALPRCPTRHSFYKYRVKPVLGQHHWEERKRDESPATGGIRSHDFFVPRCALNHSALTATLFENTQNQPRLKGLELNCIEFWNSSRTRQIHFSFTCQQGTQNKLLFDWGQGWTWNKSYESLTLMTENIKCWKKFDVKFSVISVLIGKSTLGFRH